MASCAKKRRSREKLWVSEKALEELRCKNVQGLLSSVEVAKWICETRHRVEAANTARGLTSQQSSKVGEEAEYCVAGTNAGRRKTWQGRNAKYGAGESENTDADLAKPKETRRIARSKKLSWGGRRGNTTWETKRTLFVVWRERRQQRNDFRHTMSTKWRVAARKDGDPMRATSEGYVGASVESPTVPGQAELDPEAKPRAQQQLLSVCERGEGRRPPPLKAVLRSPHFLSWASR